MVKRFHFPVHRANLAVADCACRWRSALRNVYWCAGGIDAGISRQRVYSGNGGGCRSTSTVIRPVTRPTPKGGGFSEHLRAPSYFRGVRPNYGVLLAQVFDT